MVLAVWVPHASMIAPNRYGNRSRQRMIAQRTSRQHAIGPKRIPRQHVSVMFPSCFLLTNLLFASSSTSRTTRLTQARGLVTWWIACALVHFTPHVHRSALWFGRKCERSWWARMVGGSPAIPWSWYVQTGQAVDAVRNSQCTARLVIITS